jgi:hypothetical protein
VRRQRKISVGFFHGLGDCVYFAHLIPLYQSRGYEVEVRCEENKRFLFEAAGAIVRQDGNLPPHPWDYPPGHTHEGQGRFWQGSKMGHNISRAPLPNIGSTSDLWQEYCQVRIPLESQLPAAALRTAEQWLSRLPRPVVLLHTKGNSGQARKSLPDDVTAQFYRAFIEQCEGTLLLLDWDHRVPRLASYRVRHLDEFGECPLECLLALLSRADLLIGIDSGPLHVARFTSIPTIGLWMPGHYPATYTLPRETQLNVVLADHTPWQDGAWIGKGAKAVPYLLTQGWQVLYAGYQVILTRNDIR